MASFDLDEFLPYRVSVLAGRMSRSFESRYQSRFGLRVAEWRIVAHLWQSGPVSVREIERRVDLHKSRVSRAARRLELAGYISKTTNAGDKRLVDLQLTARGQSMMRELVPLANGFQEELLAQIGCHRDAFQQGVDLLLGEKE